MEQKNAPIIDLTNDLGTLALACTSRTDEITSYIFSIGVERKLIEYGLKLIKLTPHDIHLMTEIDCIIRHNAMNPKDFPSFSIPKMDYSPDVALVCTDTKQICASVRFVGFFAAFEIEAIDMWDTRSQFFPRYLVLLLRMFVEFALETKKSNIIVYVKESANNEWVLDLMDTLGFRYDEDLARSKMQCMDFKNEYNLQAEELFEYFVDVFCYPMRLVSLEACMSDQKLHMMCN